MIAKYDSVTVDDTERNNGCGFSYLKSLVILADPAM